MQSWVPAPVLQNRISDEQRTPILVASETFEHRQLEPRFSATESYSSRFL